MLVAGGWYDIAAPGQPEEDALAASTLLYDEEQDAWALSGMLETADSEFWVGSTAVLFP